MATHTKEGDIQRWWDSLGGKTLIGEFGPFFLVCFIGNTMISIVTFS
jgi:hypothetical protein